MGRLARELQNYGFNICSVYMLDSTHTNEHKKFISSSLMALSAMMSLGLPHLTVLSKCDLLNSDEEIDRIVDYIEDMDEGI